MSKLVYFKFKSSLTWDSIPFEGSNISANDLKLSIRKRCAITTCDLTLIIKDNDIQERVITDNELIPAFSNVIVRRSPNLLPLKNQRHSKTINPENFIKNDPYKNINNSGAGDIFKNINLANSDLTEEQKLDTIVESASNNYKCIGKKTPYGCPPMNYACNKCGIPGHWINLCPGVPDKNGKLLNSRDVKRPSGIPVSSLTEVDENTPNSYLTPDGRYVVNIKNREAFLKGKKEKRPFSIEENPPILAVKAEEIPTHLLCKLCRKLMVSPVMIPCCGSVFCQLCITEHLFVPDDNGIVHQCPDCGGKVDKFESLRDATEIVTLVSDWTTAGKAKPVSIPEVAPIKIEAEVPKKICEMTDDDLLNEIFTLSEDKENNCPGNTTVVALEKDEGNNSQSTDVLTMEVIKQLASRGGGSEMQDFIKANPDVVKMIQGIMCNLKPVDQDLQRNRSMDRHDGRFRNNQSIPVLNSENRQFGGQRNPRGGFEVYSRQRINHGFRGVDDEHSNRQKEERSHSKYQSDRSGRKRGHKDQKSEEEYKKRSKHRRLSSDDRRRKSRKSRNNSRECYKDKRKRSKSVEVKKESEIKKIKKVSEIMDVEECESKAKRVSQRSTETDREKHDCTKVESEQKTDSNNYQKSDEKQQEDTEKTAGRHSRDKKKDESKLRQMLSLKKRKSRSGSPNVRSKISEREIIPNSDDDDFCREEKKTKHKSHKKSKKSKKSKSKHGEKKKHKKSKHLSK